MDLDEAKTKIRHNIVTLDSCACMFDPLYSKNPIMGTFANSEDPDEMQHNAAFHQRLHCL